MSDTDDAIFREVDEEVRQDEYKKIWDRYGKYLSTVAIVILAGVAGFQGWKYYQQKQAEDAGAVYFDALRKAADGKTDDAIAAFAAVNHAGFGQLAAIQSASLLAKKGDVDKAVAAYDAFAANAANDPTLTDLARIRAGYALVDTAKVDDLTARMAKFDNQSSAWRNEAREVLGLAAWRAKDFAKADKYMKMIFVDSAAPAQMHQRAQIMIQLIAPNLPQK